MDFEDHEIIEIREGTDNWGPYEFDVSKSIPSDGQLAEVNITVLAGRFSPGKPLDDQTQVPIIDNEYAPSISDNKISIKLQYPENGYVGRATIIFNLTLINGAKYPLFFHGVYVR